MSNVSDGAGYDLVLDWLGKMQQERTALEAERESLQRENDELRAEIAALTHGAGVSVVINGTPFYLTANAPQNPGVAIHVVPDFAQPTSNPLKDSFLLARDTGEQEAIFSENEKAS